MAHPPTLDPLRPQAPEFHSELTVARGLIPPQRKVLLQMTRSMTAYEAVRFAIIAFFSPSDGILIALQFKKNNTKEVHEPQM